MTSTCLEDGYEIFWVTRDLAVGAMPCKPEHVELLKAEGLCCVLNLCAEFCDLADHERDYGLLVRYLPIDDMGVPEPGPLASALEWVDASIAEGGKVLIHCRFGMGRTGLVLACWLAGHGLCLEAPPEELARAGLVGCAPRARPASPQQRRFVDGWLARQGVRRPGLWRTIRRKFFGS